MSNISKKQYDKRKAEFGNYSIGNLYVESVKEENKIEEMAYEKIFDDESYNFHLYPADHICENDIADKIVLLRKDVRELLKKRDNVITSECSIEKDTLFLDTNKGNHAPTSPLFKYIYMKKNNIVYEINFMRFYISKEENSVNCILAAVQFDCCVGEYVNKTKEGECIICYPTSYQGQKSQLNHIIEKSQNRNFCYNPPIQFSLNDIEQEKLRNTIAKKICEEFIYFIEKCEEIKRKRLKSTCQNLKNKN